MNNTDQQIQYMSGYIKGLETRIEELERKSELTKEMIEALWDYAKQSGSNVLELSYLLEKITDKMR